MALFFKIATAQTRMNENNGVWRRLALDNTYHALGEEFHTPTEPTPLREPFLLSANADAGACLNLPALTAAELVAHFGAAEPLDNARALAMVYAGHQFGVYVGRLGDGRGLLLGEARRGDKRVDLHLKGAGATPYSRAGDGRCVLRSTIREYLGCEAAHALGIPSTRALCVIGSREPVMREQIETGAALLRLADSHVRFGHFEYFHYQKQEAALRRLADYVIDRHHPDIADEADRHALLFSRATRATASTIGLWQAWGFAHGVMNTDNMSIVGETLDYGPFAFMDDYDPGLICNHSDHRGRYAWDRQPGIGLWNCAALAQSFSGLVEEEELKRSLRDFEPTLSQTWLETMRRRFGLRLASDDDADLFGRWLALLQRERLDYHRSMRALAEFDPADGACPLREEFEHRDDFDDWARRYQKRLQREEIAAPELRRRLLDANPAYVLRNWLVERAIRRAADHDDHGEVQRLLELVQNPFTERPDLEEYTQRPPDWGRALVVSCSS